MKNSLSSISIFWIFISEFFSLSLVFFFFGPLILNPEYPLMAHYADMERSFFFKLLLIGFPLAQIFGVPLIGMLSDHIGRKKALYLALLGSVCGYTLSATAFLLHHFFLFWCGRLLTGAFGALLAICLASTADLNVQENARLRGFSRLAICGAIGYLLAMLLASQIVTPATLIWFDPSFIFFIAAFLLAASSLILTLFYKETYVEEKHQPFNFLGKTIEMFKAIKSQAFLFLFYFFWYVGWLLSLFGISPAAHTLINSTPLEVNLLYLTFGLMWIVGAWLVHPLMTRNNKFVILSGAVILNGLLILLLMKAHHTIEFGLFIGLMGMTSAMIWTQGVTLISLAYPSFFQGKIMGLTQGLKALGLLLCLILISFKGPAFNIDDFLPFSAFLILIAFFCLLLHRYKGHTLVP